MSWLSDASANRYIKTYFNGFIDVSGGDLTVRNGTLNVNGTSTTNGITNTGSITSTGLITATGGLTTGVSSYITIPNNGNSSYYCGTPGSNVNIRMFGTGSSGRGYIDYYSALEFRNTSNLGVVITSPVVFEETGRLTTNFGLTNTGTITNTGSITSSGAISSASSVISNGDLKSVAPGVDQGVLRLTSAGGFNYIQSSLGVDDNSSADLKFTTMYAGTQHMVIKADGKVGIGTNFNNPATKLDVNGVITSTGIANTGTITSTDSNNNMVILNKDVASYGGRRIINIGFIGSGLSTDYGFIQPVEAGLINRNLALNPNGGKVGINNTTPNSTLDVVGTFNATGTSTTNGIINTGTLSSTGLISANGGLTTNSIVSTGSIVSNSDIKSIAPGVNQGILRITSQGGFNYIQSGITESANSSADLKFTTIFAGTEWMVLKANGNLGIGEPNPSTKLSVNGAVSVNTILQSATDLRLFSGNGNSNTNTIYLGANTYVFLNGNQSVEYGRWNATGLGIGTNNPQSLLDVAGQARIYSGGLGTSGSYVLFKGDNGNFPIIDANGPANTAGLGLSVLGSTKATLRSDGNFGIGTTNPTSALDVVGSIKSTQDIFVDGVRFGLGGGSIINNTACGINSLLNNSTGLYLTAIGGGALQKNTASNNTAVGYLASYENTSGDYNVAVGITASQVNQTGVNNTAVGALTLVNNTQSNNTAVGRASLNQNTIGFENTAVGVNSLATNTEGYYNTGVGTGALQTNLLGDGNTAIGYISLFNNSLGNYNTALGYGAFSATGFSNSTALGANSNPTESNQVMLGTSSTYVLCPNYIESKNYKITRGYLPPDSTYIGGQITATASATTIPNNTATIMRNITLTNGVWSVSYHTTIKGYSSPTQNIYGLQMGLSLNSTTIVNYANCGISSTGYVVTPYSCNGSYVFSLTSNSNVIRILIIVNSSDSQLKSDAIDTYLVATRIG